MVLKESIIIKQKRDNEIKDVNQITKQKFYNIFGLLATLVFILLPFNFYFCKKFINLKHDNININIFFFLIMIIFITFACFAIICSIISLYKHYLTSIIHKKRILISFTLSIDFVTIIFEIFKKKKLFEISKTINFVLYNISNNLGIISIFLTLYSIKNLIIEILNFKMHFNNYEIRLNENDINYKVLRILNNMIGNKNNIYNANQVFNSIGFKNIITKKDLYRLKPDEKEIFFKVFNVDKDDKITKNEFIYMYNKIIKQRNDLISSLINKDKLLYKLNIIITVLFCPLGILMYQIIENKSPSAFDIFSYLKSILSLSFIFGNILQDLFQSLNYIFLVRLFDVQDKLLINDNIYTVKELGMLYSTFEVNSKIVYIPNKKIKCYDIVNLRFNNKIIKEYSFLFFQDKYNALKEDILKKIKSCVFIHIDKNFKKKTKQIDFNINKENAIVVRVGIKLNIKYQDIEFLNDNEHVLYLKLIEIAKKHLYV